MSPHPQLPGVLPPPYRRRRRRRSLHDRLGRALAIALGRLLRLLAMVARLAGIGRILRIGIDGLHRHVVAERLAEAGIDRCATRAATGSPARISIDLKRMAIVLLQLGRIQGRHSS